MLVVDDEAGIREALKQVLEYEGYEVRAAASGGGASRCTRSAGRTSSSST